MITIAVLNYLTGKIDLIFENEKFIKDNCDGDISKYLFEYKKYKPSQIDWMSDITGIELIDSKNK